MYEICKAEEGSIVSKLYIALMGTVSVRESERFNMEVGGDRDYNNIAPYFIETVNISGIEQQQNMYFLLSSTQ